MKGPQGKAVSNFSTMVKDKVGKMKVAMPVDVKVDFLKPTMETIRESANNVWVQLPPQAQVAAPYDLYPARMTRKPRRTLFLTRTRLTS